MASRTNRSKDTDLDGDDEELAVDSAPPADTASVEKTFEAKAVPPWHKQLTGRALAVSFVLAVLFAFIVMKLNLTTGIVPSLNVSAGLLGFFFVKTWTKLLAKSGLLKHPFTPLIYLGVGLRNGLTSQGWHLPLFISEHL